MSTEREIADHDAERTMAFKRIDQEFHSSRKRTKERLKWFRENPSPRSSEEQLRNLKRALWD
jgi:hypothetical protein